MPMMRPFTLPLVLLTLLGAGGAAAQPVTVPPVEPLPEPPSPLMTPAPEPPPPEVPPVPPAGDVRLAQLMVRLDRALGDDGRLL